jgi:hypothetical protein
MNPNTRAARAATLALSIVALPLPALAYLDPQTGAMIMSAVVACLATVAMGIQSYWHKLLSLFRRSTPPTDPPGSADEGSLET